MTSYLFSSCLDDSGGMILAQPERAAKIVVSCAVLHNIAVHHNLPIHRDVDWDALQRPHRRRARVGAEIFAPNIRGLEREDPTGPIIRQRVIATRFRR